MSLNAMLGKDNRPQQPQLTVLWGFVDKVWPLILLCDHKDPMSSWQQGAELATTLPHNSVSPCSYTQWL